MKKLVLFSAVVFSLVLVAGCGMKTTTVTTDTTTPTTTTTTTNTKKVDATKDQCMDMVVYGMKIALAQTKGDTATATKLADEASALEKKMIAGNVEYEQACNKYMTDMNFINEVQKRTAEVK